MKKHLDILAMAPTKVLPIRVLCQLFIFYNNTNSILHIQKLSIRATNKFLMELTKSLKILSGILICLQSACAIRYNLLKQDDLQNYKVTNVPDTGSIQITKENGNAEKVINGNTRIKRQLEKDDYHSFLVTVSNPSKDTINLSSENLFAIENYQRVPIIDETKVSDHIRFNRGWFWVISGYGLITPFGYAGSELVFTGSKLLIAVPLLSYGIINNVIAYKSSNRFKRYLKGYYLLNKSIPPGKKLSGVVVVKNRTEDVHFEYRPSSPE